MRFRIPNFLHILKRLTDYVCNGKLSIISLKVEKFYKNQKKVEMLTLENCEKQL